ncbi:hypothetical protein ACFLVW_08145 [Chloroflexota bacterium]
MSREPGRFTQEIVEILPADLLRNGTDYRPKGIKRIDPRKTCLDCGYLRYVRIRQVDVAENGNPVFERTEGLITTRDRSQLLVGGNNQINAKDLDCFRGKWTTTYTGDVHTKIEKGLSEATAKRRCNLFCPFSPNDSVEMHRELHRERTARRYNLIAAFVGAIIGGALSLVGTFLYWYLSLGGK